MSSHSFVVQVLLAALIASVSCGGGQTAPQVPVVAASACGGPGPARQALGRPRQTIQTGHREKISELAVHAGLAATSASDGSVLLWDIERRVLVRRIRAPSGDFHSAGLAWTDAGELLVARGAQGGVEAIDANGRPGRTLPIAAERAFPLRAPGTWVAQGDLQIVRLDEGACTSSPIASADLVASISPARRADRFAVVTKPSSNARNERHGAEVIDAGGKALYKDATDTATAAALSDDGTRLGIADRDGIRVMNVDDGKIIATGKSAATVERLAFSSDGALLAVGTAKDVTLVELAHQRPLWRHALGTEGVGPMAIHGDRVVVASGTQLLVLDAKTGRHRGTLGAHRERVIERARFLSDTTLATLAGGHVSLWSMEGPRVVADGNIPGIRAIAARTDGTWSVVRSNEQSFAGAMGETQNGCIVAFDVWGGQGWEPKARCLAGGLTLGAVDDGAATALVAPVEGDSSGWSLRDRTGRARPLAPALVASSLAAAFTPDGRVLVTSDDRGRVVAWDVATAKQLRVLLEGPLKARGTEGAHFRSLSSHASLEGGRCIFGTEAQEFGMTGLFGTRRVVAIDDGAVAVHGDDDVVVLDLVTGRDLYHAPLSFVGALRGSSHELLRWREGEGFTLSGTSGERRFPAPATPAVRSVAVQPSGRLAVSVDEDGGLGVWDLQKLERRGTLAEFEDGEWLAVTPDDAYAGSAEVADRVAWVFDAPSEPFTFEQFAAAYLDPKRVREVIVNGALARTSAAVARPPLIEARAFDAAGARARLTVHVHSEGRVEAVRVFADGRPVAEKDVCAADAMVTLDVPLRTGANAISVVAFDESGAASNPLRHYAVGPGTTASSLWVVATGVSRYPNLGVDADLPAAKADAEAVAAAFRSHTGPGKTFASLHETVLTDDAASTESIVKALDGLAAMGQDDLAIVFFAGHGFRLPGEEQTVFVTGRATRTKESLKTFGLGWDRIGASLGRARGRVLVLLDACHSAGITRDLIVPNGSLALALQAKDRAGVVVFAASKGRQVSYEPSTTRNLTLDLGHPLTVKQAAADDAHGYFTRAVLDALGRADADLDADGFLELDELVDTVTARVNARSQGQQTPWVARRELFGDFAVVPAGRGR